MLPWDAGITGAPLATALYLCSYIRNTCICVLVLVFLRSTSVFLLVPCNVVHCVANGLLPSRSRPRSVCRGVVGGQCSLRRNCRPATPDLAGPTLFELTVPSDVPRFCFSFILPSATLFFLLWLEPAGVCCPCACGAACARSGRLATQQPPPGNHGKLPVTARADDRLRRVLVCAADYVRRRSITLCVFRAPWQYVLKCRRGSWRAKTG